REFARGCAVPDEPARRGPDDGRAIGGDAKTAAGAAHQVEFVAVRPSATQALQRKVIARESRRETLTDWPVTQRGRKVSRGPKSRRSNLPQARPLSRRRLKKNPHISAGQGG